MKKVFILMLTLPLSMHLMLEAQAVTLPSGFAQSFMAEGLNPTCMAYAPDGRIFLAQKDGRVLILHTNGDLHDEPFITLAVDAFNEKDSMGSRSTPISIRSPGYICTIPCPAHNTTGSAGFGPTAILPCPAASRF